jgi:cell division septal protein FtsQ
VVVKDGRIEPLRYLRRDPGGRVRRRRGGRRTALFLLAFFLLGVAGGAIHAARQHLLHSPRFRLQRIAFAPTRHAPEAELRKSLERHLGTNVFRLDLRRLERDLEERRWVRRAVVKRVLPDALYCVAEERTPRGLALLGGRVWLIDGEGVPIDPHGGKSAAAYSFPVLTGAAPRDPARARAQLRRGAALLEHLETARPGLLAEISEVDVSRHDRLDLKLERGGPVVRLHPRDFDSNLDRYLTLRDYLATDFGDGAYVDLRFRDRIAFRPRLAKER